MTDTVTMDANGCVALPQEVRDALRLPACASFQVAVADGRIELTPVSVEKLSPRLKRKNGRLVVAATGKPFDAVAAINEIRESRM